SVLRLPRPPARSADRRARVLGRIHSPKRDRQAIAFHYDLGNDFYRLFLGEDLVYSCAYFLRADERLEAAQRRKLDLVCRKLRLQPGERFLDIGCGWGSLAIHAARRYGVRALGVTLSREQAELATERVKEAGLEDRVEIRLADYREVDGSFDAVASVGMFEHVGPDRYTEYFGRCHALTAAGGRFLNHGITTGTRGVVVDMARSRRRTFVGTYVFPDGGLAPAWQAVQHTEAAGFELVDVEQLRPHYALTLRNWVRRLETNHEAAVAAASQMDYRIWRAYMAGSVVGFESGDLGVVQILGFKRADVPLGRRWALPGDA
ncbi:MAG: class I SAM-dependent methyltransferase, partial [Nitriliruptorales bacterium]